MSPNLFDLLKPHQKMSLNRLQKVMREGSPHYHYDVTALAASAYAEIDIARTYPRAKKYEPLDTCLIINNDAVAISVRFNGAGGDTYIIPAGVIRTISKEETPAIWQVRIANLDSAVTITVDLIDIDFWRSPEDADSVARQNL